MDNGRKKGGNPHANNQKTITRKQGNKIEQQLNKISREEKIIAKKSGFKIKNGKRKGRASNQNRVGKGHLRVTGKLRANKRRLGLTNEQFRIYEAIALPYESPAVRYSPEIGGVKTATAKPWTQLSVGWGEGATLSYRTMDENQSFAAVFRDPIRSAIYYDANPEKQTYGYQFQGFSNGAPDADPPNVSTTWVAGSFGEEVPLGYVYAIAGEDYQPHGAMMGCGKVPDSPLNFFWCDQGRVVLTCSSAAVEACSIRRYVVLDGKASFRDEVAVAPGANVLTIFDGAQYVGINNADPRGYWAFSFDGKNQEAASLAITSMVIQSFGTFSGEADGGEVFCHLMLPGIERNIGAIDTMRILAASNLMMQAASVEAIEGKICQQQIPEDYDWTLIGLSVRPYNALMKVNIPWRDNSYHGAYGFLKPAETTDFDFIKFKRNVATGITELSYPINPKTPYLVTCPFVTNASGQDSDWRFAWMVEYQTPDFWRPTNYPEASFRDWGRVFDVLKGTPQFYHNADHMTGVMKALKGVSDGVSTVSKAIGDAGKIAEGIMALV